ncbi:MAG: hypothetical protein Q8Q20_00605 [bacterium]|nr:hypothetical protein [bacterium]
MATAEFETFCLRRYNISVRYFVQEGVVRFALSGLRTIPTERALQSIALEASMMISELERDREHRLHFQLVETHELGQGLNPGEMRLQCLILNSDPNRLFLKGFGELDCIDLTVFPLLANLVGTPL